MRKSHRTLFGVWLVLLSSCAHCCLEGGSATDPSTSIRSFTVKGKIIALEPDGLTAVIQHEVIPNYMDAMTMPFRARTTNELSGLQPGDIVTFRLLVSDSESWVDSVRKTGRATAPIPSTTPTPVSQPPAKPINVVDGLSAYTFTNEFGQPLNFRRFQGQAIGLTFFFTRCPIPDFCPRLTKNFASASRKLESMPNAPTNWHFFSISFDTQADSPAVLRAYANAYGYNSNRWTFLTASPDTIDAITRNFGFNFKPDEGLFTHSFLTVVLDKNGFWQAAWPIGGDTSGNLVQEILKGASAQK
jgi:protein SCO1/2